MLKKQVNEEDISYKKPKTSKKDKRNACLLYTSPSPRD